jgi:uncharacterized protein (TIGR03437 family)
VPGYKEIQSVMQKSKILLPFILGALCVGMAYAFPFGPPNGFTSAPGDKPGVACTQCHAGTPLNGGGGRVQIVFPNGLTYTPGQTQNLSLVILDAVAATYGFEMTARLESGPVTQQAGTFTPGTNQKVVCSDNNIRPAGGCGGSGIEWIEHTQPSLANTIQVQWTPPAAAAGNVHIYVAANATNGDNTPRGDHIYAADYVLTPASTATTNLPAITGIANGASGASNSEAGSWISILGTNFGTGTTTWDNAMNGTVYPTTLGGVTVAIDGRPAPISLVNPTQINALVPATSTLGSVDVVVSNSNGSSKAAQLALGTTSPGLFTFSPNQGRYAAALVLDSASSFEYLAPANLLGSSTQSRPAKAGDTVMIYGTGFGPTTTPLSPEMAASVAYPLAHSGPDITQPLAQVTIGGQAAQLLFCGIVSPGVYQINAVVPTGVASGDQQLQVKLLSGASVPQTVFVPIQ